MHAIKKQLLYDVIHLQRKPDILCSNDAKSCYNRILHSVASMYIQRLGMPVQPTQFMLGMLQDLENHTRTAYDTLK